MSEEWGPWIEHDGLSCPVPDGVWCHRLFDRPCDGTDVTAHGATDDISPVLNEWEYKSWIWVEGATRITHYRIRKPKGLTMLERVARDVTAPIEQVDA